MFDNIEPGWLWMIGGVVLLIATVWWFTTARRRFEGPVSYGKPDEVAAMDLI